MVGFCGFAVVGSGLSAGCVFWAGGLGDWFRFV